MRSIDPDFSLRFENRSIFLGRKINTEIKATMRRKFYCDNIQLHAKDVIGSYTMTIPIKEKL